MACPRKLTINEFSQCVSKPSEYDVDINSLIGACGASPVRGSFKAQRIVVSTAYPEAIWLVSGKNYIDISQIQKILLRTDKIGRRVYEIHCGSIKSLKKTVLITECVKRTHNRTALHEIRA